MGYIQYIKKEPALRIKYLFLAGAWVLNACSPGYDETFPKQEEALREIQPTCNIYTSELQADTRSEGVKDPAAAITARLFRADYSGSAWPAASGSLVNKSVAISTAGAVTFAEADKQYYLPDKRDTKLLGIYPYTYTSMTANVVTYPVDGSTDIMATPWTTAANKTSATQPALTFKHMLSQLIITIKGEDATAISLWGTVTKVTVDGVNNSCTVTLPASGTTTDPTVAANGSTTASFQVLTKAAAAPVTYTITTTATIYGYCMIVPFTISATSPLNLTVYTQNSGTAGQSVSLTTPTAMASGKAYTIQLNMTKKAITPTATIADWGGSVSTIEGAP